MKRVRVGAVLGSSRTASDVLAPACQRQGRARIIPISTRGERRADDPCRRQFDEAVCCGQQNPADQAAILIDWRELRRQPPSRLRRLLIDLAVGRGTCEIAKRLRISPARVYQLRQQLAAAVTGFFGDVLPDWTQA